MRELHSFRVWHVSTYGKALLHAQAGPDHVFADVAKHLIHDFASAYDLLLCPKHVFALAG